MGGTPFPIPNRAVKPHSADGTRKGRVGRRQDNVIYSKGRLGRGVFLSLKMFDIRDHYARIKCQSLIDRGKGCSQLFNNQFEGNSNE